MNNLTSRRGLQPQPQRSKTGGPARKVAQQQGGHVHLSYSLPFLIPADTESWKKKMLIVLPHVGLTGVCVIYVLLGAWVFYWIESKEELKMREQARAEIAEQRKLFLDGLWALREHRPAWTAQAHIQLDNMTAVLMRWFQRDYSLDSRPAWTYATALFFSVSMITTIGYGNLVPATTEGQVFLVAYGFFGIPLMLISLANAGKFIGDGLSLLRRSTDRQISVPWMVLLLVGYMLIGAFLMHSYEEWSYGQSFYWAFISMSSIGFGDIVPEQRHMYPLTIAYILLGLALASMCIDCGATYYIRKIHFFGRKMRNAQATVTDLIRLTAFLRRRYKLSEKEINEMSLQSALKHILAAAHAFTPPDINRIYFIDQHSERCTESPILNIEEEVRKMSMAVFSDDGGNDQRSLQDRPIVQSTPLVPNHHNGHKVVSNSRSYDLKSIDRLSDSVSL